jgi:hypothetical protein
MKLISEIHGTNQCMKNQHKFDHESDVQLLTSPLFGNVDLLKDLLSEKIFLGWEVYRYPLC